MPSGCSVTKLSPRERTKLRIRRKISGSEARPRMSVFRSSKHMYAQLICDVTGRTLAAASTLDKEVQDRLKESGEDATKLSTKCIAAATEVGKLLAVRGLKAQVATVTFDRNGFRYCGRVKAVADGAREGGLGL